MIGSAAQDNNVVGYFHGTTEPSGKEKYNVILVKANGNGFRVENGFARVSEMLDDSIAIDIQNGTFSCDRFSLEGNEGGELILPLKIVNTAGRDLNCIRNFCATAEMQDTSGYAMHFNARSGTLVDACKIGGNIYHVYPIVVINPWFIGAYGLVSSGSTWAKSKSIGGMQLDEATEVATSIDPNMRAAGFIQDVGTVQTTATMFQVVKQELLDGRPMERIRQAHLVTQIRQPIWHLEKLSI